MRSLPQDDWLRVWPDAIKDRAEGEVLYGMWSRLKPAIKKASVTLLFQFMNVDRFQVSILGNFCLKSQIEMHVMGTHKTSFLSL